MLWVTNLPPLGCGQARAAMEGLWLASSTACFAVPGIPSSPFELNSEQTCTSTEHLAPWYTGRFSRAWKSSDNSKNWFSRIWFLRVLKALIATDGVQGDFHKHILKVSPWVCLHRPMQQFVQRRAPQQFQLETQIKKIFIEYLCTSDWPQHFWLLLRELSWHQLHLWSCVTCHWEYFSCSLTDRLHVCGGGMGSIITLKAAPHNQPISVFSVGLVCASPSPHSKKEYAPNPYFWANICGKRALLAIPCKVSNPCGYLKHE